MGNELQKFHSALSLGSINSYIQWVNQIPLLSLEEEQSLGARLHDHQDLSAARRLILSHLRFVVRIARGYDGYGLSQADLIQEGNIGLMKAVKRFDPSKGVRLVSFAVHWIRAEIHEFVLRNWKIVKVATTKAQRKLFFNLRRASKKLGWLSEHEVLAVAEELKVSPKDVRQMETRLNTFDESFDAEDEEDKPRSFKPMHYLEDNRYNPANLLESDNWSHSQEHKLHVALKTLDARSQDILRQRWLNEENKPTLHQLAAKYGVSAERIRQLEKNAMQQLKEAMAA